jgi:Flp pilus assembly protein TadD
MSKELVELEKKARNLRASGQFEEAIGVLLVMVQRQPDWEHGLCYYELAVCYEELGRLNEAHDNFRKALVYEPENTYYLTGLATHLEDYGDQWDAFRAYLNLLRAQVKFGEHGEESTRLSLKKIAERLKLSEKHLQQHLDDALHNLN